MASESPSLDPTGAYAPADQAAGNVIAGRYKLLEKIGEGGMGEVWVAEQTEPVRRKVALKLIKAGMDSKTVLSRFEAERQALALMDHPNIAKVLDGGMIPFSIDDSRFSIEEQNKQRVQSKHDVQSKIDNQKSAIAGRPFFAMEYVKGVPITRYCDDARLTVQERLALFVPVCQAVQHAHQKGIIHRDLKPSNILVCLYDGKPAPKVIDFGLAKAMHQPLTEHTLYTAHGVMMGTPLYMSPEQAEFNNLDIDTRTDIYSLGVVLYELLTGSTPLERQRFKEGAWQEMLRLIKEEEPPKPSKRLSELSSPHAPRAESGTRSVPTTLASVAAQRQLTPAKLSRLVKGELDWIVMKCLEKERSRRYETANGLAMDVQRYLADEPVLASPPSVGYRFRKFLRRNKGPVIAASLVLLALVAGIVGTSIGLIRAEHHRVEAEDARADEAEQRRRAEQAEADTLADYRASTDDAIEQLIESKRELGPQERAYLEKTLKRWQAFANRQGDDERSRAIRSEGHFNVAKVWHKLGRAAEARVEYELARDLKKQLVEQFPAAPVHRADLAAILNNLGVLFRDLGENDEARKVHQAARDIRKKLVEQFPTVPAYQQDLAVTHNNLGVLLRDLEKREDARAAFLAARDMQKKLVAQFPAVPAYQQGLAGVHNNLGSLLDDLGKPEEARAEYQGALDVYKKLVERFPDVPAYQHDLAAIHNNLGILLCYLGKREEARAEYQAALDIQKKLVEQFPAVPKYQIELGVSYCNYGNLIWYEGKPAESLEWFDLAIRTLKPVHDKEPRDVTAKQVLRNSYWGRAGAYDELQKHAEAVKDWDRAIQLSSPDERPRYRASCATSQIQAGLVAEAVGEVAELTTPVADAPGSPRWNAGQWYNFACVYAVASVKIADKKQEYADRAMELASNGRESGLEGRRPHGEGYRHRPAARARGLQEAVGGAGQTIAAEGIGLSFRSLRSPFLIPCSLFFILLLLLRVSVPLW